MEIRRKGINICFGIAIFFCFILGCVQDKTSVNEEPALPIFQHWVGTHDSLWNILLLEKIAKYETEDNLSLAYARDLGIIVFAEKYFKKQLIQIYGEKAINDSIFLKQKWSELSNKLSNKELEALDYNEEWNLYRRLYYETPFPERSILNTRSEEFIIWGCNFEYIIHKGLQQLGITDFSANNIARALFKGEEIQRVFTLTYVNRCEQPYYKIVSDVRTMKKNNGSNFVYSECVYYQEKLRQDIKELVQCIKDAIPAIHDSPFLPNVVPEWVGSNTNGTNFDKIHIKCEESSLNNSADATTIYDHFKRLNIESYLFDSWQQNDPKSEWGCFLIPDGSSLKFSTHYFGTETSCPLKNTKGTIASIHTHPKGLGPSWQDALHLAEQTALFDGTMKDSYVYTTEKIYNLHITDSEKVKKFYSTYSTEDGKHELCDKIYDNINLLNEQRQEVHGNYDEASMQFYGLIATLKEIDAGIVACELDGGIFRQLDVEFNTILKDDVPVKRIKKTICK